jgi:predicted TIM-barrel fold metal-dependent hydrolase
MVLRIFDAHVHLFDCEANTYAFLEHEDRSFKSIAGDYSGLPRRYLTDDYLNDSASYQVEGIVWYEFLSADPVREAQWAQHLGDASRLRQSVVVLVDFLDPALEERLEAYAALPNVVAVREHLGWDAGNALRRFAKRPDLLTDPAWRKGLGALRRHGFKCGIELFAPQLSDLPGVTRLYPDIGFTLAVMGWPLDLSPTGYMQWRHDLAVLSRCANVRIEIAAIECLFGMGWRLEEVAPWVLSVIELFGPARSMFGSHMPIAGLSVGFERLYDAYQEIVARFSAVERDDMFRGTAAAWFKPR